MTWLYIWLGVVAVCMIIEFITLELVSIWIAIGGVVAMILAACGVGYEIQIIVMVLVSVTCILGLRKITLKLLNKNKTKTNTDLIVGTKTKLLEDITSDNMGSVKINCIVWSCKSEKDEKIEKDEHVVVEKIEGNKLIVKKVDKERE